MLFQFFQDRNTTIGIAVLLQINAALRSRMQLHTAYIIIDRLQQSGIGRIRFLYR